MSRFDSGEFLELARHLGQHDDSSPNYQGYARTAISRAYYSAYLLANEKQRKRTASHAALFNYYESLNDRALNRVGNRLKTLFAKRKLADYGDLLANPQWDVEFALDEASELREILSKLTDLV